MAVPQTTVVHLLAADTSADRLDVLAALCERGDLAAQQVLLQLGPGPLRSPGGRRPVRVHTPFDWAWLGARTLRRVLQHRGLSGNGQPVICHVWSPTALAWCGSRAHTTGTVLIDLDSETESSALARRCIPGRSAHTSAFICSHAAARRRLLEIGVPVEHCAIVNPFVDVGALDAARRSEARAGLDLTGDNVVVLVLPPVDRRAGTHVAVWATLLLEKARANVRLVVPAGRREHQRVRRLVSACREDGMVRFATPHMRLPALLAAADLCIYLPPRAAPLTSLAWALAAGRPMVATAVPGIVEMLEHARSARLCRPNDPEDAVRRMLEILGAPEQARQQAEAAGARARAEYSRVRAVEQYRRVYGNLAAGRDVGA